MSIIPNKSCWTSVNPSMGCHYRYFVHSHVILGNELIVIVLEFGIHFYSFGLRSTTMDQCYFQVLNEELILRTRPMPISHYIWTLLYP